MPRSNRKATLRHCTNLLISCCSELCEFLIPWCRSQDAPPEVIGRLEQWTHLLPTLLVLDSEAYTQQEIEQAIAANESGGMAGQNDTGNQEDSQENQTESSGITQSFN